MDIYIGIDLGTSNSAIACFDGSSLELIPNSRGETTTPSVVRITENGVIVGAKAQNFLYKDPHHTHKEFKRLMGTSSKTKVDSFGSQYSPEQLAAEVLKSLRNDALKFRDLLPEVAVITVPALFELPQSNATAEAGRLAGFKKVELLPEPVASALAAGWSDQDAEKAWLVFDLGGGTFDVSLVETRDGLLRVVGHDGDNFLGGRDIDRAIVDWLLQKLLQEKNININADDDQHKIVLRHIYQEVENAKIRLSANERTSLELDFTFADDQVELDVLLLRSDIENLAAPIVDRAIEICLRLIAQHGLTREQIGRVVLVGGPAHMPIVKQRVTGHLAPLAEDSGDPMTLVARGAALYATTIGLKNEATVIAPESPVDACDLWIQYPSVSSDLSPDIMGRLVNSKHFQPHRIQFFREDGLWLSSVLEIDTNGVFSTPVELLVGKNNRFNIALFDKTGQKIVCKPEHINIVHGITISDPPLSRSIGVALANGNKRTFIERGTPLPAKRTFLQHTSETLIPGAQQKLNIPIVQGERDLARFCRKVGNLVINSHELTHQLPAGSAIEITIEVDRGANLKASAVIIDQKIVIHGVAELLMPSADPAVLRVGYGQLQTRLVLQQKEAFARRDQAAVSLLERLTHRLNGVGKDLLTATSDEDACLRAQRNLIEIEAEIELLESREQLDELLAECQSAYMNARLVVESWGNSIEKQMLADCEVRLHKAFELKRINELERLIEQMKGINSSAYKRSPEFWTDQFSYIAARAHEAKDLRKATKLVEEGRQLVATKNNQQLESIVRQLWIIIPEQTQSGNKTHDSGIQ